MQVLKTAKNTPNFYKYNQENCVRKYLINQIENIFTTDN